jgi:glycosyltransferase involved in cell wall biosynthesis
MKKKIKILFAIDNLAYGGAPAVVYYQSNYLDKSRFEVYLMTLYPTAKPGYYDKLSFLDSEKIKHFNLSNRSPFDLLTWIKIYRYLKKEQFDIVYTHLFLTNLIVRAMAWLARVPVIIAFEHSIYYNKKPWQIKIDNFLSRVTKKIIVSKDSVAEFTAKQEKIEKEKFSVIPNPVVMPEKNEAKLKALEKDLAFPKDAFIVLNLGRFSEEKGQKYLIEAAEKVASKLGNIYFIIVGHGYLEQELKQEIENKRLTNRCKIVIAPEDAKYYYYLSDLFVLPSLREGQSIVTYEAMFAGLPVIASDLPTIREIITDEENGLLVEPGNSKSIAEKIIFMYNHPNLREQFTLKSKDKIKPFTLDKSIMQLEDLLNRLIKQKDTIS